jgi:hypothetical protein
MARRRGRSPPAWLAHTALTRNLGGVSWLVSRAAAVTAAAALAVCALTACSAKSGSGGGGSTSDVTVIQTITSTPPVPSPGAPYVPAPAATVAPLGSAHAAMPAGEVEGTCPYISNDALAGLEGDHVYRTATLTGLTPVGCRFYFYAGPFEAIADILPTTFATATDAYNAMVATGAAGTETLGVKGLITGVDGVLYRTAFFGPDVAMGDWACAFAAGKVMVVVHTQQTNVSFNARAIATAIAPKF